MNRYTLPALRLLSGGEFRSGEEIARRLGVTRASVSNALKDLGEAGLKVFKVRGRGYRLAEPVAWLDRDQVLSALGPKARLFDLAVLDETESTNTLLMAEAGHGAASGRVIVAEAQTHGRGRLGRPWHSGLGGALTFSLLWRFDQGVGFLSGLSLAVGVALTRALEAQGVTGVALKWPNDVLHDGKKLAGILIELQADMLGPSVAVIGVGLNVKLAKPVRSRIDQAATDLSSAGAGRWDRNTLLAALLLALAEAMQEFAATGFNGFRKEWESRHAYQGKRVRLELPDGGSVEGVVKGASAEGALVLAVGGAERKFLSGEISLRAAR
ncbi:MAG: biotin--[acetyl-CoA-carboxylase] ligase [Betaproteobacteria bacterium]|nr:biotin--[acetyl-CoA-carboxylase] ligase [Betaproteobacteria bacterium]